MGYKELKFPENSLFLVTGGAGFIGSNLCEAILNLGHRVRCLDDLSTGKQANVDLFIDNPNYEFIKGDIKDLDTCMKACEGVDYVLNQAAWGSVPRSIEMPLFYCANNIQGTLNMLEAARQQGVKKFVYASSSSVYGDEPNLPKKEGREGNLLSRMRFQSARMRNGQSSTQGITGLILTDCAISTCSADVRIQTARMQRLFRNL
jgi:UDP-N-acetylglucosamine 4-epimerase